jgi:hypothetical protein
MFYKSAYFMQNKANFRKSQMDVKLNITRDYEEKMHWTFGENKPKQSQFQNRRQTTEGRRRMTDNGWQMTDDGGKKRNCPAGTVSKLDMHPLKCQRENRFDDGLW